MKRLSLSASAIIVCLLCATSLRAQQSNTSSTPAPSATVPRLVKFSGVLNDLTGKPLSGPVEAVFSVYQNESDDEPLWQETQTVKADAAGRYTVLLGAMSEQGLPVELFTSGEARWLGVAAGTLPEQPRVLLVSVPYALEAGDAATLGGKPASAYLLAQPSEGATIVVPQAGGETTAGGAPSQPSPATTTPKPQTVGGSSAGTLDYVTKWVDSSNDLGNSLLFDNGASVGIGTTTPGTLNGTSFPAVLFQASQSTASSYLTASTELAGGYAGVLLNRGMANANNRLWAVENQPAGTGNNSSQFAISTYSDAGTPTALLSLTRSGNLGIKTTTPGTLNGTYFPTVLLQAAQAGGSTYLSGDTELAGGYAGLLLNRGAASANNRLWAIENQPSASNTSSQFAISAYTDAGMPTSLMTILRSGNVGIGTTTPGATLEVNGTALFDNAVSFGQPVTFANGQTFPGSGSNGQFSGTTSPVVSGTNTATGSSGQLAATITTAGDTGVYGSGTDYGVYGASNSATGVYGINSTNGSYGELGTTNENDFGTGVLGSGSGPNPVGVEGRGETGVLGEGNYGTDGYGSVGVYGVENPGGQYGVLSYGDMAATGTKSAVVALPDKRVVELYAVESPELWFEDFGSGQLRDGVGEVAFDSTFAFAANMEPGYHVFLTPKGDCEGLYVTNETATGFEVRELRGGKSNVAFDYRIIAKRRGYEGLRMNELDADDETVAAIREFVQRPPHRKKLTLHKPPGALKPPAEPAKAGVLPAARAPAMPKPLEPPKLAAPPEQVALPKPPQQ